MNGEEIKLLSKMKQLIKVGKRRFQIRSDRDYIQDLLNIGITEELAWEHITYLNSAFFFFDSRPSYFKTDKLLVFKKTINGTLTYIKLRLENNCGENEVVCISFHQDIKNREILYEM